jgi:ligand-binding sensor domain-containing protein
MSNFSYIRYLCLHTAFTGILYLLVQTSIFGQEPRFKKLTVSVPEEDQQYNCLFQDDGGLMWMGTSGGLYTFDGNSFSNVTLPESIQGKGVTAFWQDSRKRYWVGLESGDVFRFDGMVSFHPVLKGKDTKAQISTFLEDKSGRIWIGTYGQGARIVLEDQILLLNSENGLSDNYIYSMIIGPAGKIWMGTDNGLNLIELSGTLENVLFTIQHLGLEEGLPDLIIRSLYRDVEGRLWIGMHDGGVTLYDPENEKFIYPEGLSPWPYGPVLDMLATGDNLWIVTARQGIVEFTVASGIIKKYFRFREDGLNRIKLLMKDEEDNLWFMGSNELWMSFANKLRFLENVDNLSVQNIHALIIDHYDRLWFANDQGVFSFHIHKPKKPPYLKQYPVQIDLKSQKIMSLYYDSWDHIWIGTFGQGVIRMDPNTGRQRIFNTKDGLDNGNILSIAGNDHEIWFGTLGGAYRISADKKLKNIDSKVHTKY